MLHLDYWMTSCRHKSKLKLDTIDTKIHKIHRYKKGYEIGDGNTQGSCTSSLHKCQSDGMCAECTYDSECTGLSNKCVKRICVCGDASGRPCNSTISNVCDSGVCMCGDNPECGQTLQDIVIRQYGEDGCDEYKCSFDRSYSTCKQSRGSEVCEKITTFYNPLYIEGEFGSDGTPLNFTCDDEKGKYLGTYQCLGNAWHIELIYSLQLFK